VRKHYLIISYIGQKCTNIRLRVGAFTGSYIYNICVCVCWVCLCVRVQFVLVCSEPPGCVHCVMIYCCILQSDSGWHRSRGKQITTVDSTGETNHAKLEEGLASCCHDCWCKLNIYNSSIYALIFCLRGTSCITRFFLGVLI